MAEPPHNDDDPSPGDDDAEPTSKKSERKRQREKQRRFDLANAFDELAALLSRIEPEDLDASQNSRRRKKKNSEEPELDPADAAGMTRLDLIGRTIDAIGRLHRENLELRQTLEHSRRNNRGGSAGDDKVSEEKTLYHDGRRLGVQTDRRFLPTSCVLAGCLGYGADAHAERLASQPCRAVESVPVILPPPPVVKVSPARIHAATTAAAAAASNRVLRRVGGGNLFSQSVRWVLPARTPSMEPAGIGTSSSPRTLWSSPSRPARSDGRIPGTSSFSSRAAATAAAAAAASPPEQSSFRRWFVTISHSRGGKLIAALSASASSAKFVSIP